jgi:hypothetical protein
MIDKKSATIQTAFTKNKIARWYAVRQRDFSNKITNGKW